ncbi:MAG: hypothetical protein HY049_08025 [Acidobacteria bacterium]|nr:hypothetical protein [Acidobacteriota bacterium]
MSESAINTSPVGISATPKGWFIRACSAGPPSPANPGTGQQLRVTIPATVLIVPPAASTRLTCCPCSSA